MDHRSSFAASDTTYHSFNDIELFEPASPPRNTDNRPDSVHGRLSDDRPPTSTKMQRQDSGYESYTTTPRTSISCARPKIARRISNASTTAGPSRPRTRPSTRRSAKSYTLGAKPTPPLYLARPGSSNFFHFPSPPETEDAALTTTPAPEEQPPPSPVPQTTHYWTSDSTRRMEYAAIDAASRGVKGWIRRNLVPECFVPRENRHVSFDDDTGSVRRYRLELEEEPCTGEKAGRRRGWLSWSGRKNSV